jgi:hypothetical protein
VLRRLRIALLLTAVVTTAGRGQTPEVILRAGDRIRLTRRNAVPSLLRTRLVLLDDRGVTVRGGDLDSMRVFSADSFVKLELSLGKDPALVIGAPVAGGLLGAVLGPVFITEDARCERDIDVPGGCGKETPDAVVGALVGAVAFGLAGGAVARERWQEIPLDRLFVDYGQRALRIGMSWRF